MNIDTILLSEYASADSTGRLTVVNAFNRLRGPGPEWGLPIMYLTVVAHGPKREAGHRWDGEIRLIDAQRELVGEKPRPFILGFPEDDGGLTLLPPGAVVTVPRHRRIRAHVARKAVKAIDLVRKKKEDLGHGGRDDGSSQNT